MKRIVIAIGLAVCALMGSRASLAATTIVFPDTPEWFKCCGSLAQISDANPRSGNGSLELGDGRAFIRFNGAALGTYGTLESLSFDWFIDSFTDATGQGRSLPPEPAL